MPHHHSNVIPSYRLEQHTVGDPIMNCYPPDKFNSESAFLPSHPPAFCFTHLVFSQYHPFPSHSAPGRPHPLLRPLVATRTKGVAHFRKALPRLFRRYWESSLPLTQASVLPASPFEIFPVSTGAPNNRMSPQTNSKSDGRGYGDTTTTTPVAPDTIVAEKKRGWRDGYSKIR